MHNTEFIIVLLFIILASLSLYQMSICIEGASNTRGRIKTNNAKKKSTIKSTTTPIAKTMYQKRSNAVKQALGKK
jgi:hypothetical protein